MAKIKNVETEVTPNSNAQPVFPHGEILGAGSPFIVTDNHGAVWRVDPNSGTACKVVFKF